MKVETI